jgi:signal transduction histidine kinase
VKKINNNDLFDELRRRFLEKEKILHDLVVITRKFEDINEKLRQAESHKSNFLSNIRNEINNPLAVILGRSSRKKIMFN